MTYDEIKQYRKQLVEIVNIDDAGKRLDPLVALAKKVGASTTRFGRTIPNDSSEIPRNIISESEIVHNIQTALQTASMLETCRTAVKSYKIAIGATIIAAVSALAAWAAATSGWWRHG